MRRLLAMKSLQTTSIDYANWVMQKMNVKPSLATIDFGLLLHYDGNIVIHETLAWKEIVVEHFPQNFDINHGKHVSIRAVKMIS